MTDKDYEWQERISKIVHRVSKDLIANDEGEISEVIRRRLFEDIGPESVRKTVAKNYADWCFERRAQLPPEWTAVDSTATDASAKEHLRSRFELCYPFHPAALSVFQRKWQSLPQYQQTRGTLAMFAQWVSIAFRDDHANARKEQLVTLGSAPLHRPEFRSIVLAQLGEPRLLSAIETDIAGDHSHTNALDADAKDALIGIHRRVGSAILFESSGGQTEKIAYLPDLRFALCEPGLDTTSVDNAAHGLESKAYFIRKVGSDGYRIGHQPTLKKVVSDRRASLDEETEICPEMKNAVKEQFYKGAEITIVPFPEDGAEIPDNPKLTLVLMDPAAEWSAQDTIRQKISDWTKARGSSPRLYPGSLVWCLKKPGRELHDSIENLLAWQRVKHDIDTGTLSSDLNSEDRGSLNSQISYAREAVRDDVWGGYRFALVFDKNEEDHLKVIDLGAGHSSGSETISQRIITALKSQALLSDSIGAGYIERNWPSAFNESGAWPLPELRQRFIDGTLTRLLDPDSTLRSKIGEFVHKGNFGLASGLDSGGSYSHMWYNEPVDPAEVVFEQGVFLLTQEKAKSLKNAQKPDPSPNISPAAADLQSNSDGLFGMPEEKTDNMSLFPGVVKPEVLQKPGEKTFLISGKIAPEDWNRLGIKIIPKLRPGKFLEIKIEFSVTVDSSLAESFQAEIQQILDDIGVSANLKITP
jgi:hypothetical protein